MENKDEEICGKDIRVDAIQTLGNIPECMSIAQRQLHKMSTYSDLEGTSLQVGQKLKSRHSRT